MKTSEKAVEASSDVDLQTCGAIVLGAELLPASETYAASLAVAAGVSEAAAAAAVTLG